MRTALLAAITLATSAVSTADADSHQPVPPRARKLAERGRELHQRGDYARAIAAFKEAYVLAPSPGLLFNLAQAYRLQGNCDDAALMYRRYITAVPPSSDERALAEAHLATVVRCSQQRSGDLPPDATLASIPPPPPAGPDPLFDDRPAPAAGGPGEPGGHGKLMRRVGVGTTIGGGVALGLAAYYGVQAHNASADVERLYAEGASWKTILPVHQRGERAETAATWLGIGGGITAAAGVTLLYLGWRAEHASPLTVAPVKGGAQVGMSWAF
jgi:tetratricopeptide (TPR) repeat protein